MSYLNTTRVSGNPVTPTQWGSYVFDALMLLFIWMATLGSSDLSNLSSHAPIVTVPRNH